MQVMLAVVKVPLLPLPTLDAVTEGAADGLPIVLDVPTNVNTQVGPLKEEGAATGPPAFAGITGTEASGPLAGEPEKLADGAGAGAAAAAVSNKQATKHGNILRVGKSQTEVPEEKDLPTQSDRIGQRTAYRGRLRPRQQTSDDQTSTSNPLLPACRL